MSVNQLSPVVAIIANYPKGTGYAWWLMESFWREIEHATESRAWDSVIIYPPRPVENDTGETEIDLSRLEEFLSNGTLWNIMDIYRLIRQYNIRSIYLTDRAYRSWKYLVLKLSGINSIVVHDHTPGDRPAIAGVKGLIKRILNSMPWVTANLVVAISPLMRERHILNARIPSSRIVTVTNGIIVRDLIPGARKLLLDQFGLHPGCYLVCVVGRLNPYKRFDFAINCVGKLAKDNPESNPVLIVVGDGPDRERLESIAGLQAPNSKIIFTGQVSDVWSILCGVDTVLHPSAGEGLSLAILEAMAAAQPVVVPSLPSVSQTIEHGYSGLVYMDGSLDNATKMLNDLSNDKSLRVTLGKNARTKVLENYQLERAIKDFDANVIPVILSDT